MRCSADKTKQTSLFGLHGSGSMRAPKKLGVALRARDDFLGVGRPIEASHQQNNL